MSRGGGVPASEAQMVIGVLIACVIVALWLTAFSQGYRIGKSWAGAHFSSSAAGARN